MIDFRYQLILNRIRTGQKTILTSLSDTDMRLLYDAVVSDSENWDGEQVSCDHVIKLMFTRLNRIGMPKGLL